MVMLEENSASPDEREGNGKEINTFLDLCKVCAKNKELSRGTVLHEQILKRGLLQKSASVACALINLYAKCGDLIEAEKVLKELPVRDVFSWSSLVVGYAQNGQSHKALECFHRMHKEGISPNEVTFSCILKACGNTGSIQKGKHIHNEIIHRGLLEKNIVIGNALVDMYTKLGMLVKAQQVLDEIPIRDVVSWSTLIAGYAQQGQAREALECFEKMQREGLTPNEITFTCILKACGIIGAVEKGQDIHEKILHRGMLQKNIVLGNALVDMYVKCGLLSKARKVLEELPIRDVVSWSSLIAGYADEGKGHEALNCFVEMQREGLSPNMVTYICILKACGSVRAVEKGKQFHEEIVNKGLLLENIMLGNALVDMYAKCGMLGKAQEVLENLPVRDIVSWNTLITGYVQHGRASKAFRCFAEMQREGHSPDQTTFLCMLKACGTAKDIDQGRQIHHAVVKQGMFETSTVLCIGVVDMYAKCGALAKAREILEGLPARNVDLWNALIVGYGREGRGCEALTCFEQMQKEGISPNEVTFIYLLKACSSVGAIDKGIRVHDEITSWGILEKSINIGNSLIDMYAKCGMLAKAQQVLESLPVRDTISWNALISGYVKEDQSQEALKCFTKMQRESITPDEITLTSLLKACGTIGALAKGKEIHYMIVSGGLLEKNVMLGTALVDTYAKCGLLAKAQQVLEELPVRDEVTWNALLTGYVQQGQDYEALNHFTVMQREGLSPDEVTFSCVLKACGAIGAIDKGVQIHDEISSKGLIKTHTMLGTALVGMYVKCGVLEKAEKVLQALPCRDTFSWNALIAGYAEGGDSSRVLECFEKMQREGLPPDDVTFLCILNACSRTGKSVEAQVYYENMSKKYGITPKVEHHTCMIVVYGSEGQFDKAMSVIETMPSFSDPSVWLALLSACKKWGNVKLGRFAFENVTRLDENVGAAYVLMVSIYAAANMLDEARNVESMRMKKSTHVFNGERAIFV